MECREKCVASALHGILCVAKTTSPVLQDTLLQSKYLKGLAGTVASQMASSIVTMCKLPQEPEFPLWFNLALQYMRFFDGMMLLAPHLATGMLIPDILARHILHETFLELFLNSSAETVLVTTYSVFTALLRHAVVVNSLAVDIFVGGLFRATVTVNGRLLSPHEAAAAAAEQGKDNNAIDDVAPSSMVDRKTTTSTTSTAAFSSPSSSSATSSSSGGGRNLFSAIILPKIHDVADHIAAATLFFIAALIERAPHLCLKYLVGLDGDTKPCRISRELLASRKIPSLSNAILRVNVDVNNLFPRRLVSSKGLCGSSTALFNEDILARMLVIEANCEGLERHRVSIIPSNGEDSMSATEQTTSATISSAATAAMTSSSVVPNAASQNHQQPEEQRRYPTSRPTTAVAATTQPPDVNNFFFDPVVCKMPFVAHMAEKLSSFIQNPFSVNAGLTSCLIACTLLPDIRCFLTLLDPSAGPWTAALAKVKYEIDLILDREAAAIGQRSLSSSSNSSSASSSSSAAAMAVPSSLINLFHRYAQRPFFEPNEQINDDQLAAAMRSCKTLVEACVCLEGFRHELYTAAGYILVNQSLAELAQRSPLSDRPAD
jgi:hypothetical protein